MAFLKQLSILIIFVLTTVSNSYGLEESLKVSPKLTKKDAHHRGLLATDQLVNTDSALDRSIKLNTSKLLKNGPEKNTDSQTDQYYFLLNSFLITSLLNLKKHNTYYFITNVKFKSNASLARAPPKIS